MKQKAESAKLHSRNVIDGSFKEAVEGLVREIPYARVMTYGQIAALCSSPRAARIVGGVAHYGDSSLPWHRVVNKKGGLARGYPGGMSAHAQHLRDEGVYVSSKKYTVSIDEYLWTPEPLREYERGTHSDDG